MMNMNNSQQKYMNEIMNPHNIEFDALHINYITPSFDAKNINNYGIGYDQLSNGPQSNNLHNASMQYSGHNMMQPQQMDMNQQMGMMQPQQMGIMGGGSSQNKFTRILRRI